MADRTYQIHTPFSEVTDLIIAALEQGVARWVCPWDRAGGRPRNGASGHVYRGINAVMTSACGGDPRWFTFRQSRTLGGQVKKGEKGTPIVFYQFADCRSGPQPTAQDEADSDHADAKPTSGRSVPFARLYWVWNHAQIEWKSTSSMASTVVIEPVPTEAWEQVAKDFVEAIGADITHGGTRACYMPHDDRIQMPDIERFADKGAWYATAIHELGHWTGHSTRLNRDLTGRFRSQAFGAEELVAELASAFLSAELRIPGQLQHAAYINSWITMMKADSKAIFTASRMAQQAADYLIERWAQQRRETLDQLADDTVSLARAS